MTKQELYTLLEENKQQFFDASDAMRRNFPSASTKPRRSMKKC